MLVVVFLLSGAEAARVVVVGGGVGGLATAGRLAGLGAEVTVLEKNERELLGGRLGEYRWGRHRWETGASLLLMPEVYAESLAAMGDAEPLDFVRVRPSYAVWFDALPERGPVELGGEDVEALRKRLELEEEGAFEKFETYLETARDYLGTGWPAFIEEDVAAALPTLGRFVRTALARWPLETHEAQLRKLFPKSPRLRALCSFNDLYVGLTPYDAPAVFSLLSAIEICRGVWYLRDGLGSYARRLVDACERRGVEVRCGVEVTSVDDRGVDTTAGRFDADHVVVNADLAAAEPRLARRPRDTYDSWTYSTTSYSFYWALDKPLPELRHHNVFLATDRANPDDPFRPAWDWLRRERRELPPFNFYVCAASRTDDTAAPRGRDSIMVLVPAPPLGSDDDRDRDLTDAIRDALFRRLGPICGDVKTHIIHERVIAPREWRRRYALRRGAIFGLSHGLDQLALFRPARRSRRSKTLSFVGASTRPGNGVPLVLTSAKLCAREVARQLHLEGGSFGS
ncbi:hypothetical protein CTAYLR_007367 [Chrysophaeum taylorii]|uniref:Amine oxidase domain-containing protein n=1 Tax=Chrysophaeum taylorii TaxID=2483200 RepID=A0AAD7XJ79_9STRA|nr:hypothetical protein CTAYLR_007367 [Chrysophaeum taylorii]